MHRPRKRHAARMMGVRWHRVLALGCNSPEMTAGQHSGGSNKKCPAASAAGLSLPSGTGDASRSVFLEGEQDIEYLLAVARLLQVADRAFAAVGDARFGDLVIRHFVERGDVLGA